jgi:hypothetical protein
VRSIPARSWPGSSSNWIAPGSAPSHLARNTQICFRLTIKQPAFHYMMNTSVRGSKSPNGLSVTTCGPFSDLAALVPGVVVRSPPRRVTFDGEGALFFSERKSRLVPKVRRRLSRRRGGAPTVRRGARSLGAMNSQIELKVYSPRCALTVSMNEAEAQAFKCKGTWMMTMVEMKRPMTSLPTWPFCWGSSASP